MKQLPDLVREWMKSLERDFWEGIKILSQLTINRTLIRNLSKKENKYNREKLYNEIQKLSKTLLTENEEPKMLQPKVTSVLSGQLMNINTGQVKLDLPVNPSISTPPNTADGDDPGRGVSYGGDHQPADENDAKDKLPADHPGETVDPNCSYNPGTVTSVIIEKLPIDPINTEDAKSIEELEISYSKMFNKKGMLSNSLHSFEEENNAGRKEVLDRISDIDKAMQSIDAKIKHFKEHGVLPALVVDPPPISDGTTTDVHLPDDPVKITRMINNERSNISKLRRRIKRGHPDPEKLTSLEQNLQKKVEMVNELERRLGGSGS